VYSVYDAGQRKTGFLEEGNELITGSPKGGGFSLVTDGHHPKPESKSDDIRGKGR